MNTTADISAKAHRMVTAYLDGFTVQAFGGVVYAYKPATGKMGAPLMNTSEAAECRDVLLRVGVLMERADAGGSPRWVFRAT